MFLINSKKRKENGMDAFETGLYYYSLGLFVVANCCFWGLLIGVAAKRIRDWFIVKEE
jgi:hypothetical protein